MMVTIVTQRDVSKWCMGTLGILDAIVTFQDGADLDFSRLKRAQAAHEHTE